MRFNSRAQASSYIDAGQLSGNSSAELYRDINRASPDYDALINKIRDIQSARRQAEMNYAGKVGKGKMEGNVIFQRQKATSDLEGARLKAKADIKMAGLLGALGSDVTASVYKKLNPEPDPPPPIQLDLEKLYEPIIERMENATSGSAEVPIPWSYDPNSGTWIDPQPNWGRGLLPSSVEQEQTQGAAQVSTPLGTPQVFEGDAGDGTRFLPSSAPLQYTPSALPAPAAPQREFIPGSIEEQQYIQDRYFY